MCRNLQSVPTILTGIVAENFQGQEINFGKSLLVYFLRPPDLEIMNVMRPLEP